MIARYKGHVIRLQSHWYWVDSKSRYSSLESATAAIDRL